LIVSFTILNSLPWFTVNAAAAPSIQRFQSLWDKRNLSHLGHYTMTLRLSRYYEAITDTSHQVSVWEGYTGRFPGDPRGYANTVNAIKALTPGDVRGKLRAYGSWLAVDPENDTLRRETAAACRDAAEGEGEPRKA